MGQVFYDTDPWPTWPIHICWPMTHDPLTHCLLCREQGVVLFWRHANVSVCVSNSDVLAGSADRRPGSRLTLRSSVCRKRLCRQAEGFLHSTRLWRLTVRWTWPAVVGQSGQRMAVKYTMTNLCDQAVTDRGRILADGMNQKRRQLNYCRSVFRRIFVFLLLKPFTSAADIAIKHPVPDPVLFDIRTLWRSGLSVRVPGCQKL